MSFFFRHLAGTAEIDYYSETSREIHDIDALIPRVGLFRAMSYSCELLCERLPESDREGVLHLGKMFYNDFRGFINKPTDFRIQLRHYFMGREALFRQSLDRTHYRKSEYEYAGNPFKDDRKARRILFKNMRVIQKGVKKILDEEHEAVVDFRDRVSPRHSPYVHEMSERLSKESREAMRRLMDFRSSFNRNIPPLH